MINTIFYFPLAKLTYSDYATAVQNGEISGRTIVLDKASGKIFNQGKEYGYSKLEIDESVDRKIDDVRNDMSDVVDELNNTLDDLNDHIDDVNNNLDNVINDLDDSIQDKVEDMVSDSEWIQQNWPQGVTQYDSGWNENVKAYLLTVGLWDYGDDGSIVTKWSQLRQSVNNVSSEVNQVTKQGGRLDTLQSAINQEITDRGEAITQLSNTYTNTDAQTKKVLEWMYSGLKSSASANKSFNELYSAANSGDTTAISGLRTDITNQLGNYVASTDLSSRVEGVLKNGAGVTSLANLAQKSDITSATTTLVNTYQLAGLQTSLSGLLSKADANEARLDIVTSLGENNTYTYNKSTLDSAVAGLMAETNTETNLYLAGLKVSSGDGQASTELSSSINNNKNDIARLATKITGDNSEATVEAKLNGMTASLVTTANLATNAASAGLLAKNELTGEVAKILATVGKDGSNITLDADQLNITSDFIDAMNSRLSVASVTTEQILAAVADGLIIKAGKVSFQKADGTAAPISINVNDGTLQAENAALTGTFTSSSDLSKIIINTLTRTEQYDPNAVLNTVSSSIQMLAYNNMTYNKNDEKIEKTAQSLLVDVLTIGVNEVFIVDNGLILDVGYDGMIRINSTAGSGRVATFSPENISCYNGYGAGASLSYGTIRATGFSKNLSAEEKISYTLNPSYIPDGASKYTLSMGFSSSGGSGLLLIRTETSSYELYGTYGSDMLTLSENNGNSNIYTSLVAGLDARLEFDDGTVDGKVVIGISGISIGNNWGMTWSEFKSKLSQL